jgi:hypothetical protein
METKVFSIALANEIMKYYKAKKVEYLALTISTRVKHFYRISIKQFDMVDNFVDTD